MSSIDNAIRIAIIKDTFVVKPQYALPSGSGLVVVFDNCPLIAEASSGDLAIFQHVNGCFLGLIIDSIKTHGENGRSFFFKNCTELDLPKTSYLCKIAKNEEHEEKILKERTLQEDEERRKRDADNALWSSSHGFPGF